MSRTNPQLAVFLLVAMLAACSRDQQDAASPSPTSPAAGEQEMPGQPSTAESAPSGTGGSTMDGGTMSEQPTSSSDGMSPGSTYAQMGGMGGGGMGGRGGGGGSR